MRGVYCAFHSHMETAEGWELRMRSRRNCYIPRDCLFFSAMRCADTKACLSSMTLILSNSLCCKTVTVTLWLFLLLLLLSKWNLNKNDSCLWTSYSWRATFIICKREQLPKRLFSSFISPPVFPSLSAKWINDQSPHYSSIITTISNLCIWLSSSLQQLFLLL